MPTLSESACEVYLPLRRQGEVIRLCRLASVVTADIALWGERERRQICHAGGEERSLGLGHFERGYAKVGILCQRRVDERLQYIVLEELTSRDVGDTA